MDKYIEMIRIRFLMMLAYRTNYYTGILIYCINIGAYYFLWSAIYSGKSSIQGMSIEQMTTYVAVSWMARAFYFNNIDREIAMEIKEGKVAIELIRPLQLLRDENDARTWRRDISSIFSFASWRHHYGFSFSASFFNEYQYMGAFCVIDYVKFHH